MSLVNHSCWVVGGVGVIGRGIAKGLLQAGATVIVNSRSSARLKQLEKELGSPERLVLVHGSLLPGHAQKTVSETLGNAPLNHVFSHGAVRFWTDRSGLDETYSLGIRAKEQLLDMTPEDFAQSSAQLASLHFSAAQQLVPRLQANSGKSTYTFVTGDGSGKPGSFKTAMSTINSHHIWGLSAALRHQLSTRQDSNGAVICREIRVNLPINRSEEERKEERRKYPLSEEIGNLCAGVASSWMKEECNGRLIEVNEQHQLESLCQEYESTPDDGVVTMPTKWESNGNL